MNRFENAETPRKLIEPLGTDVLGTKIVELLTDELRFRSELEEAFRVLKYPEASDKVKIRVYFNLINSNKNPFNYSVSVEGADPSLEEELRKKINETVQSIENDDYAIKKDNYILTDLNCTFEVMDKKTEKEKEDDFFKEGKHIYESSRSLPIDITDRGSEIY